MIEGELLGALVEVDGYLLAVDRAYQPDDHLWVQTLEDGRVRVGMDALGVETSGTLAQIALAPVGTTVARGEPFGSVEAAKFVGPLVAPITGAVAGHNDAALADPSLVERDPYGGGWLAELVPAALDDELPSLLHGDGLGAWFEAAIADYRLRGVIAE